MFLALVAQVAQAQCQMVAGPVQPVAVIPNVPTQWTQMTLAHNGTVYVDSQGGSSPMPVTVYNANGGVVTTVNVPLDFRSVFERHDGTADLYARAYNSRVIYQRTPAGAQQVAATLSINGPLDAQSAVVWDPTRTLYLANNFGTVAAWNSRGTFISSTPLAGMVAAELASPQGRGLAVSPGGCMLTYHAGVVSSWNTNGTRADTLQLVGAGTTFDSYWSFSYTNGLFWVADSAGGNWRAYNLGL
jgi:hypothetical protein